MALMHVVQIYVHKITSVLVNRNSYNARESACERASDQERKRERFRFVFYCLDINALRQRYK